MMSKIYLLSLLLLLAACTPPAPTPEPYPAPVATTTATDTPTPEPTLPPAVTVPPVPATLTAVPTSTPEPYPVGTREAFAPEGFIPEPAPAPRLGVAATLNDRILFCDGRTWQWSWSAISTKFKKDCEGLSALPVHVPMLVWSPATFQEWQARQTADKWYIDTWLVFNECEHDGQCETSPEDAARWYHDVGVPFATSLNPAVNLIVGGSNAGECGMAWMERFVTYYRATYDEDVPRAGWHFHIYPELWAGPGCAYDWGWNWTIIQDLELFWNEWLRQADNIKRFMLQYGREGDEVYVTESGCLSPAPSICPNFAYTIAERSLRYYDTDGLHITRFSWFADGGPGNHWPWTNLYIGTHETSLAIQPTGKLWLNHDPLPAVPLRIYKRYFPIVGYRSNVIPEPRPTAAPPGGYPGPGEEHP